MERRRVSDKGEEEMRASREKLRGKIALTRKVSDKGDEKRAKRRRISDREEENREKRASKEKILDMRASDRRLESQTSELSGNREQVTVQVRGLFDDE